MNGRRWRTRALAAVTVLLVVAPADAALAKQRFPRGYRVVERVNVGHGLRTFELRKGGKRPQIVHVARLARGSKLRLQPIPSKRLASGKGRRLEPTSRLCRRARCLVAVNGDFFGKGAPAGGVLIDGVPVKAPRPQRKQAIFDASRGLVAGRLKLSGEVITSDLRRFRARRVDQKAGRNEFAVMTGAAGRRTGAGSGWEMVLRVVDPPGGLRVGQVSVARVAAISSARNRKIPSRGVIVVGKGKAASKLRLLRNRIRVGEASRDVLLRIDSTPDAWDSVGGKPVILRKGRIVVRRSRSSFVRSRHPRTLVGRTRDGAVLLVTVDGRARNRSGMSLYEAARLMRGLGAIEAINLDGGGSTTFVKRGRVQNRPSDGRERRVAVALGVVRPTRDRAEPMVPHLDRFDLGSPDDEPEVAMAPPPVRERVALPAALPQPSQPPGPERPGGLTPLLWVFPALAAARFTIPALRRRRRCGA